MKKIIFVVAILIPNLLFARAWFYVDSKPDSLASIHKADTVEDATSLAEISYFFGPPTSLTTSYNYVNSIVIMKPGVTSASSLGSLEHKDFVQTVAYQDDLGRTIQTIGVGQSGQGVDIITPVAYNRRGLVDTVFLPFPATSMAGTFRTTSIRSNGSYTASRQAQYYTNTTSKPYSVTIYRNAPDARVTAQGGSGSAWQPGQHAQSFSVTLNTTSFPIRYFKADGTSTGNYPAESVLVNRTFDENGNEVRTFTNLLGQTVSKEVQVGTNSFLETKYVYDEYGRLKYQMSPKTQYDSDPNMETDSQAQEFIYKYKYDGYGRVVEKKKPGAAVQYFVYDKLGRLVLTQDGNLRASKQWFFVKYDFLNRPVYNGIYTNATDTTRDAVQDLFDDIDYDTEPKFEVEEQNATYHGYSNSTFPTSSLTLFNVVYYDHYNFDRSSGDDYTYDNSHLSGIPASRSTSTRGFPTGSKTLIIGTTNWLVSCVFYDSYDRPVQTLSNNHLNLNVQSKTSVLYTDLAGHVGRVKVTNNVLGVVTHVQRYEYDANWRTTAIYHSVDGSTEQQIAAYVYNDLGQLVDRKLHKTPGGTFIQSVDYRYHHHGWLKSINNSALTDDGSKNDDTGDYFGMELRYGETETVGNTLQYNGNVSAVIWKGIGSSSGDVGQRAYTFYYDRSDRLVRSNFKMSSASSTWNKEINTINEAITYDQNGNILRLGRRQNQRGSSGLTVTSASELMDSLMYTYSNGNQLSQVEDSGISAGFINGRIAEADEYTYDVDGNLTADRNKGIDSIKYNALGRVVRVKYTDGRVQTYVYSALGTKLSMKTLSVNGTLQVQTDYVNGFQYENADLKYQPLPEGRITRSGVSVLEIGRGECSTVTGFHTQSSNLSAIVQNGNTYLRVSGNNASVLAAPGVYVGKAVPVQANKKYVFRVKGYVEAASTYQPVFFINANTGLIRWSENGPKLPKGEANEGWISHEFTTPANATSIEFGVFWWKDYSIPVGTKFYLNETEFKPVVNEYQYSIADHQGNTRVVFSSVPGAPKVSFADMESSNADFPNDQEIFKSNVQIFNYTDSPSATYSNLLNGGYNGQIGIAKSYKVYPGDKVKIEAYAKYRNETSTASDVTAFASAILAAFGAPAPAPTETGTISSGLNGYGSVVAAGNGPNSAGPKIFVNIVLFDRDHKFLDVAYETIDPGAEEDGSGVPHDYMSREYTVKEAGYAYLYVSNENPTRVDAYFDDVTMTYTPGHVIQYNEYYPFGARTANSWDRVEEKDLASIAEGLVAKIPFDGNGGDLSSSGNDATISGGTTTTGQGRPYALALDGTDDYAQIADDASLDFGANNFAMAIWVKKLAATSNYDNREVVHKWDNIGGINNCEWMLATASNSSDNKPTFYIAQPPSYQTVSSPDNLEINQWYHLTVVRDGANIKLYVNSVLKGTLNVGTFVIQNVGRDVTIGKSASGLATNAVYDDLYIYNRALSEDEIRYLYLDKPELMVNNYLYNAGSEYNNVANWYETASRGYDPFLGRMNGVDPMADMYSSLTPYNYAGNMPTRFNDPTGATLEDRISTMMWYEERAQTKVAEDLRRYGYVDGGGTYDLTVGSMYSTVGGSSYQFGTSQSVFDFLGDAMSSAYGGYWSDGQSTMFANNDEAFAAGVAYNESINDAGIAWTVGELYSGNGISIHVNSGVATVARETAITGTAYYSNRGNYAGSKYYDVDTKTISALNPRYMSINHGGFDPRVNAPNGWDVWIPIWGSGKQAAYWFQQGDVSRGILYTGLAISDVAAVKAMALALGKLTISGAAKASTNFLKFGGDEAVVHFGRHADQVMKVTGKSAYNLRNYVDDANWIIQNGTYSSKLNGYYHFMGNAAKGESLFGFVGLKNGGSTISTFHIKTATQLGLK